MLKTLNCTAPTFRRVADAMGYYCKTEGKILLLSKARFSYLKYEKEHPRAR